MALLRKRHRDVLAYITNYIADAGEPPTLAQIATAFGWKSSSTVHDILVRLEDAALIKRTRKARGISLTEVRPVISPVELPSWEQARRAIKHDRATPLDLLIYHHQPGAGQEGNPFRERLATALNHVRSNSK